MVEVFKTNVRKVDHASQIVAILLEHFPGSKINFDLEDCDKILRVEGHNFLTDKVKMLVEQNGFDCSVLE